ncbi:MAG TPA: helix-turn-helix transcriptional regulator, partial [Pyrinomonadaceae bacterium]|nr:helix-turn-helix transcriptional regulator [Pyrinomonadaceae bacterium]
MRFSSRKPTAPLADFVDNFWLYEGYEGEHSNERILPTGTMELVINLRENELRIYDAEQPNRCSRFSGSVVSGAYGKGFISDSEEEAFIMGIHFKPGGAFPFLGVPADELTDTHIDLETLWGSFAIRLRERLCEASTAAERFHLLQETLINHMFRPMEHHYAVSTGLEVFGRQIDATVRDIARSVGLSERHFIQVFKAEVGVTPKLFSRVQRFQRARATIHRQEKAADWAGIAIECGYFDQSHLIRDFQEFSGVSPAAYLRQYNLFLDQNMHIKRYHFPLSSKLGQFYPIQPISCG